MKNNLIGLLIGFSIGFVCRLLELPIPAPPALWGSLIVLSTTLGAMAVQKYQDQRGTHAS